MTTKQLKWWACELKYDKEAVKLIIDIAYESGVTDGRTIELKARVEESSE